MIPLDSWPTEARDVIANARPCTHYLWDDPTSYCCTEVGKHRTHVYQSRDVADAHDRSEREATA